jgi:hypothetical protein
MAAFVVACPRRVDGIPRDGARISIFPGSASPSVFAAREPFWIGYGFVSEPVPSEGRVEALDLGTRFELSVDGMPVALHTEVELDDSRQLVRKHDVADFGSGLPVGWHRFSGRWYDGDRLVLTSERSIQFVEPS